MVMNLRLSDRGRHEGWRCSRKGVLRKIFGPQRTRSKGSGQ